MFFFLFYNLERFTPTYEMKPFTPEKKNNEHELNIYNKYLVALHSAGPPYYYISLTQHARSYLKPGARTSSVRPHKKIIIIIMLI